MGSPLSEGGLHDGQDAPAEHLDLVEPLNAVMMIHYRQAQYAKAEEVSRRILFISEKTLGPDHPYVATVLNNLATFLQNQGSYAEARSLLERSLAIFEKVLGPERPDVAVSLNYFAGLLNGQGSYAEARPLYEQGLRGMLNHLSLNRRSMTEHERFQYLATQKGPEPFLLNLVALQENGPTKE